MAEPKWIRFVEYAEAGKTSIWDVESKSDGGFLGVVKWGRWRRYCFYPAFECLFDATCLRDIAEFCDAQTVAQKQRRAVPA